MKLSDFVQRADELIAQAEKVLATKRQTDYGTAVDGAAFAAFRVASLSFLRNVFGIDHPYFTEFDAKVDRSDPYEAARGKGILIAARDEIAGGWTSTARGLITAEVFSDFLEMAEHLLAEHYKDPAAVMVGSVLEEHLRQICRKASIDPELTVSGRVIGKKADVLNAELVKAGVYGKLEQKMVTAWLDLRNKAAHGHYGEYTPEQVRLMYQGVLDFTIRFPV